MKRLQQGPSRVFQIFLTLLVAAGPAVLAAAETAPFGDEIWPQFRGPTRDGHAESAGLARAWGESGPVELWRRPLGAAFSGIVVDGPRLWTTESDGETEHAILIDRRTGHTTARHSLGPVFVDSFGNGPRVTPTLAGDRLFFLTGQGRLVALDRVSGRRLWWRDLARDYAVELPDWGFSSSPLVEGDRVLVDIGGSEERGVVALSVDDGSEMWAAGDGAAAYGSPVSVSVAGRRQIIAVRQSGWLGLSVDGEVLWRHPWAPKAGIKPSLPVQLDDRTFFVSASYGVGSSVVRLSRSEDSWQAEELWAGRVMRNHFNSSVLVDGKLYGFDNATLKCIDPFTGSQLWAKRGGLGKGSLIAADGLLIVLTETGTLKLVEASPDGYVETASHKPLEGRSWTEPSLAGGLLYLRNQQELVALDLRLGDPETRVAATALDKAGEGTEDMSVEAILAAHSEAQGGKQAIAAIGTLRLRGTMESSGRECEVETVLEAGGAFQVRRRCDGEVRIVATDGKQVMTEGPDGVRERLETLPEALQLEDLGLGIGFLASPRLAAESYRIEKVGTADLEGVPTYHLRLHLPSGRSQDWYLSTSTFLPVRRSVAAHSPYFGEYIRDYWYSEYRPVELAVSTAVSGTADPEKKSFIYPHFQERNDDPFVAAFTFAEAVAESPGSR